MPSVFYPNQESPYIENPRVAKNTFIGRSAEKSHVPTYEEAKSKLPSPIW